MSIVTYLAADIGGTNVRLQLVKIKGKGNKFTEEIVKTQKFRSQNFPTLSLVILEFLKQLKVTKESPLWPKVATLAIAGAVKNNTCMVTNLAGWPEVNGHSMQQELGITTLRLINDFEANGYGVLGLRDDEKFVVNAGEPVPGKPIAVIGAGTGLGEAFLTAPPTDGTGGGQYVVSPTEGGHSDFAPRTEQECDLLLYVKKLHNISHVSAERLVSGPGLDAIYSFLAQRLPHLVSSDVTAQLSAPKADKPAVIARHAHKAPGKPFDPLCAAAHDMFESLYGAEAGNLALKTLAFGGVYLCGGVAPKMLWAFKEKTNFWNGFTDKGRFQKLMEKIPLYVSINEDVGLLGARVYSRRLLTSLGALPKNARIQEVSEHRAKL